MQNAGSERGWLGVQLGLQLSQGRYCDGPIVNLDQSVRLEAAQVARYQFANGADLGSQLAVVGGKFNGNRVTMLVAFCLAQPNQQGDQAMPDSRERELFDNPDQPAQASAYNPQYLESHLRMLQAESVKILFAEKQEPTVAYSLCGGWIAASVKDGQFSDRVAGAINGKHLLAAADR